MGGNLFSPCSGSGSRSQTVRTWSLPSGDTQGLCPDPRAREYGQVAVPGKSVSRCPLSVWASLVAASDHVARLLNPDSATPSPRTGYQVIPGQDRPLKPTGPTLLRSDCGAGRRCTTIGPVRLRLCTEPGAASLHGCQGPFRGVSPHQVCGASTASGHLPSIINK